MKVKQQLNKCALIQLLCDPTHFDGRVVENR